MTQDAVSSRQTMVFEPVTAPEPWHAFRVELTAFPLPESLRQELNLIFKRLALAAFQVRGLQPTLWLDTAELHRDDGARLFSSNARRWSPTMGFAFDPAGPAPRTVELSDLMDAPWGTPPKIFDRSAILVSNFQETAAAYRLLCGRGLASLLFFAAVAPALSAAVDRFMDNSRTTLEPLVASNAFKHHHFYLPLLSSASLSRTTAADLLSWLGNADLYLREACEDKELLLLGRDLPLIFEQSGMRRLSSSDETGAWEISFDRKEGVKP